MLRSAWQPAFQSGSLEGYSELMDRCAANLASWLQQVGQSGQAIDMVQELKRMALQVVGGIVCSTSLHCLSALLVCTACADVEGLWCVQQSCQAVSGMWDVMVVSLMTHGGDGSPGRAPLAARSALGRLHQAAARHRRAMCQLLLGAEC